MGSSGRYAEHVPAVRAVYRRQRDALVAALRAELPEVDVVAPSGGWFLWLRLPDGLTATGLLAHAERHAVSFLPGRLFHTGPVTDDHARLSFSLYEPAVLAEAARRLGAAFRECC